jgi:hypothetical protein
LNLRSFRVRGWAWLLAMLWVVIGAGGAVFATIALIHPGYTEVLLVPPTIQWPGEPQLVIDAALIAEVAWGLLVAPVLIAGFVRLRGWQPRNWLLAVAWAGSWVVGLVLMIQATKWVAAGLGGTRAALSIGEIAILVAWLALGAVMSWILARPPVRSPVMPPTADEPMAAAGRH